MEIARAQQEEVARRGKDQYVVDGAVLSHPGLAHYFTRCCKAKILEWPIMVLRPDQSGPDREEVIGRAYQCSECHRITPYKPNGHRAKVQNKYRGVFTSSTLGALDDIGLTYQPAAGPGVAYWLTPIGQNLEPMKFVRDAEPPDPERDAAKDAYQPGDDFMDEF